VADTLQNFQNPTPLQHQFLKGWDDKEEWDDNFVDKEG